MLPFCTVLLVQQIYQISMLELDMCYDTLFEIPPSVLALVRYYIFIGDTNHHVRIFHLEILALMLILVRYYFLI